MRGWLLLVLALLVAVAVMAGVVVVEVRQFLFSPSFEYMYVTRVWCPPGVNPPEPYTWLNLRGERGGLFRVNITPWAGYEGPCTRHTTLERISRWECRRPGTICKSPLSFELW